MAFQDQVNRLHIQDIADAMGEMAETDLALPFAFILEALLDSDIDHNQVLDLMADIRVNLAEYREDPQRYMSILFRPV